MKTRLCTAIPLALLLLAANGGSTMRSSLLTIEGEAVAIETAAGEGDLTLVSVSMILDDPSGEELEILLGPESALQETGFSVAVGDRVRARIFPADSGPLRVHKILNITQNTVVRLRTLYQIPLWNGAGTWQGGLAGDALGHSHQHGTTQRANGPRGR